MLYTYASPGSSRSNPHNAPTCCGAPKSNLRIDTPVFLKLESDHCVNRSPSIAFSGAWRSELMPLVLVTFTGMIWKEEDGVGRVSGVGVVGVGIVGMSIVGMNIVSEWISSEWISSE